MHPLEEAVTLPWGTLICLSGNYPPLPSHTHCCPFSLMWCLFPAVSRGLLLCFFYRKLKRVVHKALLCQGMAFKLQWAGRERLNAFPKPAYSRRKETLEISAVWKRWTWKELKCKRHATSLALNWKTSSLWAKCFQNDACPCKIRETSSKEYL